MKKFLIIIAIILLSFITISCRGGKEINSEIGSLKYTTIEIDDMECLVVTDKVYGFGITCDWDNYQQFGK